MTRQEFEAIIAEINNTECFSLYDVEDECELFNAAKPKKVADNLDLDTHRWYTCCTQVYKIGEWFLGLNGASDLKSEEMSWKDAYVRTAAFEMEAVPSVTYKPKG